MPWTPKDADSHTQSADDPKLKRQWAHVADKVLQETGDEGLAVKEANGVVKKQQAKKSACLELLDLAKALIDNAMFDNPNPSYGANTVSNKRDFRRVRSAPGVGYKKNNFNEPVGTINKVHASDVAINQNADLKANKIPKTNATSKTQIGAPITNAPKPLPKSMMELMDLAKSDEFEDFGKTSTYGPRKTSHFAGAGFNHFRFRKPGFRNPQFRHPRNLSHMTARGNRNYKSVDAKEAKEAEEKSIGNTVAPFTPHVVRAHKRTKMTRKNAHKVAAFKRRRFKDDSKIKNL